MARHGGRGGFCDMSRSHAAACTTGPFHATTERLFLAYTRRKSGAITIRYAYCSFQTYGKHQNSNMYSVYVLHSQKDCQLYVGYSANLVRRMAEHDQGCVRSTRNRRPLHLIFHETYINQEDALRREKYLKTTQGKRALKHMLKCTLASLVTHARPSA